MSEVKVKKKFLEMAKEKTELNLHEDHVASCLCCRHLSAFDGEPGYGEYTPSSNPSIECSKNVVDFSIAFWTVDTLKLFHDWAPHCPLFEAKETPDAGLDSVPTE